MFAGPCVHLMCAPCAFYIERYTATVYAVYIYMCVSAYHIMKPGEGTGAPGGACMRSENMPTY